MKKYLVFISFILTVLVSQAAERESILDSKWNKYFTMSGYRYSSSDIVDFALLLKDEIIYFQPRRSYGEPELKCFLKLAPDTIWIRKKKNPQIDKDFKVNSYYHGVEKNSYKTEFYTPLSEISDFKFRVDSISIEKKTSSYSFADKYRDVYLVNILTDERFIWRCDDKWVKDLVLYSESIGEKMIHGMDVIYIRKPDADRYYSDKASNYVATTIRSAVYRFEHESYRTEPTLELSVMENDIIKTYSYCPTGSSSSYYDKPKFITEEKYNELLENDKVFVIDSQLPPVEKEYNFPFHFRFIMGKTKYGRVFQEIKKSDSYSYNYISSDKLILIADKQTLHGQDYYIGLYENRCFYISCNNVTLLDAEEKSKMDSLLSCSSAVRENFFNQAKALAHYSHLKNLKKFSDEIKSHEQYGLSIESWGVFDQSEYTNGTGFSFHVYNPTKKTIKYITVHFVGYNAVDDAVTSMGKTTQTVKCIGPIEPDESASYSFDYVWFTDIVEYAKIKSIVVQYTNGTSKTITGVSKIEWSDDLYDYFNNGPELKSLKELN